jgi:hypothetical protein
MTEACGKWVAVLSYILSAASYSLRSTASAAVLSIAAGSNGDDSATSPSSTALRAAHVFIGKTCFAM